MLASILLCTDVRTNLYNASDYPNPRCASLIDNGGRFGQDRTDIMHYFWQLPEETRDWASSQSTAWLFYAMHQLCIWCTIYVAQLEFSTQGSFQKHGVNMWGITVQNEAGKWRSGGATCTHVCKQQCLDS